MVNAMPKVLFLNGPPQCGKDTAGREILKHWMHSETNVKLEAFKEPILAFFTFVMGYDLTDYENMKNIELRGAGGYTLRQAMIEFSEHYMKKRFGKAVFGDIALRKLQVMCMPPKSRPHLFVYTDCGFEEEVQPIVDWVGKENCLIAHILREGKTFEGDSRDYITIRGVDVVSLWNEDLPTFQAEVRRTVNTFLLG